MSAEWTIGGVSLGDLGLEFVGGTFNTGSRSVMTLRKTGSFTGSAGFAWGSPVTLKRDDVAFFQGKVNSLPCSASEGDESQEIEIVDAWQDLEETIYEEEWPLGARRVMLPIAILGRRADGSECTDAEQIVEAVNYAATHAGVDIRMGMIPAGLPLWQSEVRNVSVAEVIRLSLRFHPDWVPWIDHSSSPPTLNFTARAGLAVQTIDIGGGEVTNVSIVRRDDLKPDAVKMLYLNPTIIEGVTYRDRTEDLYPSGGPSAGPRVISNVIELAGGQMQFQKQRIQTRKIPTDHAECRTWLKKSYPQIRDIDDGMYRVSFLGSKMVPLEDEDDLPPVINPRAKRIVNFEKKDIPRELVAGSIEEWMRKRVGKVTIDFEVTIHKDATAADRKVLEPLAAMESKTVTATDAITKIYKGITQWVEPESAPAGIAEAIYTSLSAYQYEGSITTVMEDVAGDRYHGCKLNIAGGRGEWATMNALVHSVSFDIASGSTTISVGPAPFLAAQDMLELARLLRGRPVTWMSEDERTSNELGAEKDPGSKGDTVGGFYGPTNEVGYRAALTGRFTPYIGGPNNDRLFLTPGTVSYCQLADEERQDDEEVPDAITVKPIFPTLDEEPLDAEDPPFFDVGDKSSAGVWLCAKRMVCSSSLVSEGDSERIELVNKGDRPEKKKGEIRRLLFECDLTDMEGGGKKITKLDQKIASDVDVWYECINLGGSSQGTESFDSEDWDSSDMSDESDPSGGSSDSDADCPWRGSASWYKPQTCYNKEDRAYIGVVVRVGLSGAYFTHCKNWKATVTAPGGTGTSTRLPAGGELAGGGIILPLGRKFHEFQCVFMFEKPPCKKKQSVVISISSEDKVPADANNDCCGSAPGSKTFEIGTWPAWCGYNGRCGTTVA